MKAALLTGIGKIEVQDVPRPDVCSAKDVLLKIGMVGICGSDVHYYRHGR